MKEITLSRLRSAALWPHGVLLLVFGLACTLIFFTTPSSTRGGRLLLLAAQAGAAAWATYFCVQAGQRVSDSSDALRRPWLLVGASMACLTAALLVYFLSALFQVQTSTFTLVADLLRVAQQPLMWLALWRLAWFHLMRSERVLHSLRVVADTLMVVLSVLVLYWVTLIQPGLVFARGDITRAMWLFYPLADLVTLCGVVLLLFAVRGRLQLTRVAALLLLGFTFFTVTNVVLLLGAVSTPASITTWSGRLSIGWIWASVFIAAAALTHGAVVFRGVVANSREKDFPGTHIDEYVVETKGDSVGDQRLERRWQHFILIWLPYAAALLVSFILIGNELKGGHVVAVQQMLPAMLLLFAVIARQMLTLLDNLRLSEHLRSANQSLEVVNSDLEKNVAERTQHLSTLHGITSTLNTSLDRRTVLRVALERTITATGADGGGIWLRTTEDESPTDPRAGDGNSQANWELAHSHGFDDNMVLENMLRDLAVSGAEGQGQPVPLLPSTRLALQYGFAPSPNNVVLVPIRWGGALLGSFGLLRHSGSFTYDDRALVESVALETGTALQNARLYQEARHRADRDSVTGLLNHRAVQERLNAELKKARRGKVELSVVMMDLNNFKFFNDTYGHPVGDEVLRTVAHHLREVCRETDIVGRYGGDEFIALLPQTDSEGAEEFSNRVIARLNEQHFQADSGSRIPIEMAFGWAVFPRDADSALELLTTADANLYESKHSGGLSRTPSRLEATEQGRIEVRKLKNRAAGGSFGVLDALVTAIDNKDHYTRRHSEEVTHYSLLVAKELGYTDEALRAVRISGLLHDVGKIAVPDEILRHPGQLGPGEWEIMKQHPVFGALIVKDLPHLDEVLDGVRHHHERWDGKGYPDGLREEDIPKMGRLLAVGDCFSAMTTNRPYRKAFAPEDALREIERGIGIQFDPVIAAAFIKVMRREISAAEEQGEGAHKPAPPDLSEEIREEIQDEISHLPANTESVASQ